MREKLQIYDELEELQERSGGVKAVILIAVGTLIWLISQYCTATITVYTLIEQ